MLCAQAYANKILIVSNLATDVYVSPKSRPSTCV
jgi:hypothetical protein